MPQLIRNILWPTDFSKEAQEALLYAGLFAKKFSARITALHVAPDFVPGLYETSHVIQSEISLRTDALKKQAQTKIKSAAQKKGVAIKKVIVTEGSPAKRIIETAEKERVDLIVMGKIGQSGLKNILVGSVANQVLRHSPVPILVTKRGKKKLAVKKILVPTDFAKEEDVEQKFAGRLAEQFGASLTFIYVLELYGHEFRMVDHMFQSVFEKFKRREKRIGKRVKVAKVVTRGVNAAIGIDTYSRTHRFDLIVMATCAGGLSRFILGSNTEKVISNTDLPVLALPPKYCA
ncbi:MAG: universal stress protein [Candidatus Aminicenantes bacterium]|nr:universal stress protein [Candidatus Aminicenantes bacterium]